MSSLSGVVVSVSGLEELTEEGRGGGVGSDLGGCSALKGVAQVLSVE